MQSKKHSLVEAVTNTAIGYLVGVAAQALILPLYGYRVPLSSNFKIALWFTGISIIRGYVLRRWFTKKTEDTVPFPHTALFALNVKAEEMLKSSNEGRTMREGRRVLCRATTEHCKLALGCGKRPHDCRERNGGVLSEMFMGYPSGGAE